MEEINTDFKIKMSIMIFLIFNLWGLLSILKPELMVRTSSHDARKRKPTKDQIKSSKVAGYISICLGIFLIIIIFVAY